LISGILRYYPQYTLKHIFNTPFKYGGLTKHQIIILFTHASEGEYNLLRTQSLFNACAAGGKDPEDLIGKKVKKTCSDGHQSLPNQSPRFPIFEHPDKYKDLSFEEKEAKTREMMSAHKAWANTESSLTDFGKDEENVT
jgi:hypothetical protein